MRKMLLPLAAVVLCATGLSACGGSLDDPRSTGTEVNTYRGEDITCIHDGLTKSSVRTCDYAAFYAAHPDLLDESADEADSEGVWWTEYRGEKMPCYKEGMSQSNTLSCDYEWFYALHPDLLATADNS